VRRWLQAKAAKQALLGMSIRYDIRA